MTFVLIVHKKNNLTINNSQVITLSVLFISFPDVAIKLFLKV